MSLRLYLIILVVIASLLWGSFWFIVNNVNPEITNWSGFLLFYLSLYLAVSVTSALVGFVIRFIFLKKSFVGYSVKASFRQSFLFALLVVCSLLLLVNDLFNWWNMVLLILSLAVLEYFFICYELNSENGEEASTFTDDNINNEV